MLNAHQVNHGEMLPSTETNVLQLNTDMNFSNDSQQNKGMKKQKEKSMFHSYAHCVDEDNQNENYLK